MNMALMVLVVSASLAAMVGALWVAMALWRVLREKKGAWEHSR